MKELDYVCRYGISLTRTLSYNISKAKWSNVTNHDFKSRVILCGNIFVVSFFNHYFVKLLTLGIPS